MTTVEIVSTPTSVGVAEQSQAITLEEQQTSVEIAGSGTSVIIPVSVNTIEIQSVNQTVEVSVAQILVEVQSVGAQGPAGEGGGSYAVRYDKTSTYIYAGEAEAGSLDADPVWRIKRVTRASSVKLFADGNSDFDNIWNNRASYSYS